MSEQNKIRVRLRGYDIELLDQAAKSIISNVNHQAFDTFLLLSLYDDHRSSLCSQILKRFCYEENALHSSAFRLI